MKSAYPTISHSPQVPLETVTRVSTSWLVFDRHNPRLVGLAPLESGTDIESVGTAEMVALLYRTANLQELLQSIAANGYLDIEPLIVEAVETSELDDAGGAGDADAAANAGGAGGAGAAANASAAGDAGAASRPKAAKLRVLEGNRRLAAIKLFQDGRLRTELGCHHGTPVELPKITPGKLKTLAEVSVYRVAHRADANAYIGFKHMNGAVKWSSYAKAKFAAKWHREQQVPLGEIARHIGDEHDTVTRMVHAIYVLEQAERAGCFQLSDRADTYRFSFSYLYVALARSPYMEFLGPGV